MNQKEALKIYKEVSDKLKAYQTVLSTAYFDDATIAPKLGANARNNAISTLTGEAFVIQTDPKYIEAVKFLKGCDLGEVGNRDIYFAYKNVEDIVKFTKEEVMEYSLAQMESKNAWLKAKETDNYKIFEPHLLKLIELTKKRNLKRNPKKDVYETCLDDYEEGMDSKTYDKFFELIKTELVPLIKEINAKQGSIKDDFLYKNYPTSKQEIFMADLRKFLNYDNSWGYMGVTEHPFTIDISRNDVRITTYYDENNVSSSIYSVIHETGHAFYMHQTDPKFDKYPNLQNGISSGMHESQSRFLENCLGRKESFFTKLYPKLVKLFPENLKDVSLKDFINAVNVSKCSLIRVDADELTYPIHILIRYEMEKEIFSGKADLNNLNKLWNKKYKEYLGIDVLSDKVGILQDMHWSDASFGYFPTYALGSAIAAQLYAKMEKDIDIDDILAKGKMKSIMDYLKNNVQKYGALYDYKGICKIATGENFNPKYYINYLKKKYKKLYKIK